MKTHKFLLMIIFLFFISTLVGCQAFVRKFTRKPKKREAREEVVLMPQDYSPSDISVEDTYRRYFVFWKSWQDELITALGSPASQKKRMSCLEEAVENLENLRPLLFEEKQKDLDIFLSQLRRLREEINKDIYGTQSGRLKKKAETLKRAILRNFSYPKVKAHLR